MIALSTLFYFIKLRAEVPAFESFFDLVSRGSMKRTKIIVISTLTALFLTSMVLTLLRDSIDKERLASAVLQKQNEARLSILKAQINPHFLFNSLHNIYTLSILKSDKTSDAIMKLSQLLRYAVYIGENEPVGADEESIQIRAYLDLFELTRITPRAIAFQTSGDLKSSKIEPMILLPIVENAIKHTNFSADKNAFIDIGLMVKNKMLRFYARNTITTDDFSKEKVGGVGLNNIKERLKLRYGKNHEFTISTDGLVYSVLLTINENSI